MWTSRGSWLTALGSWAADEAVFAAERQRIGVAITAPTLCAVAEVMAEHADHATGRHVAITRATIAERVGCDVRTVTAAWRLLRNTGWAVEAQRGHGSPGTPAVGRRPSVYHLTPRRAPAPARSAVQHFHLPPSGGVRSLSPVGSNSPSTHACRQKFTPTHKRRRLRAEPRPLALQRLAAELVANSHGLGRVHVGAICDALRAAGVDPGEWTSRALIQALNTDMVRRGWNWPDQINNPAGFLLSRVRLLSVRPGPHTSGGCAAGPEQAPRRSGGTVTNTPPRHTTASPAVLTTEQRERIAAAKDSIRADIAAARRRAATGRTGARSSHASSTKSGSTHGAPPSVGPEPSS
ncbi:MAG: rep protein [Mycobacterium sp.]|nr:rep protein [Mycobacterium sp.]